MSVTISEKMLLNLLLCVYMCATVCHGHGHGHGKFIKILELQEGPQHLDRPESRRPGSELPSLA
jgi:hypothetical protein